MKRRSILTILMISSLSLAACTLGYAEMVRRDTAGGILALKGHEGAAMQDAQQQMAAHCGGAYTIVAEENVVVGQQTNTSGGTSYGQNTAYSSGSSTTQALTEHRITYQCGGQVQVVAQPAGAPQPAQ